MRESAIKKPSWLARIGVTTLKCLQILSPNAVGFGVITVGLAFFALLVSLTATVFQIKSYLQDAGPQIPWNREALFEAVHTGDVDTVEYFLSRGMSPHVIGDDRQLSMFLARNTQSAVKVLRVLLRHKLNVNFPYALKTGIGPQTSPIIYYAVLNENAELVEELLRHGADVNVAVNVVGGLQPTETRLIDLARAIAREPDHSDEASKILRLLEDAGAR